MGSAEDFLLPGQLVLRLIDADDRHRSAIRGLLGIDPIPAGPSDADLTVRFVPAIRPARTLRLLGQDAATDGERFFVVRSVGGERCLIDMPLAELGHRMVITCDAAIASVPQLVPLLNATALVRGILPLHASAAVLGGRGIAAAGWSKGGKTEALLAMHAAGGTPIADEWCYVDPASRVGQGLMAPIRLSDDHLRQLGELRNLMTVARRTRMTSAGAVGRAYAAIDGRAWKRAAAARWIHRFVPLVEGQRSADLDPRAVFGRAYEAHRLDRIALVVATEHGRTAVRNIPASDATESMVAAHMHHRLGLDATVRTFRFAFPAAKTKLDRLEEVERSLLLDVFGTRPVSVVEHPHPVPIAELRDALVRIAADDD